MSAWSGVKSIINRTHLSVSLFYYTFCKLYNKPYRNWNESVWNAGQHCRDGVVTDMTHVKWRAEKLRNILNGLKLKISWQVNKLMTVWFLFSIISRGLGMLVSSWIFHTREKDPVLEKVEHSLFFVHYILHLLSTFCRKHKEIRSF